MALWLIITLVHVEENGRCSPDHIIQWRINRNVILYEEHVRINLFSNTNDNKNSASTLLSWILFFGVCLHWFSATILTLLCKSSCSGHVILAQIWLDAHVFALRNWKDSSDWTKKNICIFGARMFAVYLEASIGSCCFIPARHRIWNSFRFFALSVERPLLSELLVEQLILALYN